MLLVSLLLLQIQWSEFYIYFTEVWHGGMSPALHSLPFLTTLPPPTAYCLLVSQQGAPLRLRLNGVHAGMEMFSEHDFNDTVENFTEAVEEVIDASMLSLVTTAGWSLIPTASRSSKARAIHPRLALCQLPNIHQVRPPTV